MGRPPWGPPWERPIRSYGPIGMYGDVCTYLPIGMSRYLRIGPHGPGRARDAKGPRARASRNPRGVTEHSREFWGAIRP